MLPAPASILTDTSFQSLSSTSMMSHLSGQGPANPDDVEALCDYLKQIQLLQKKWIEAGRMGFVTQDIHGLDEHQFELLKKELDNSWKWELGEKQEWKEWVAFLRCVDIDFWHREKKVVVQAPLFKEDFSFGVASNMQRLMNCELLLEDRLPELQIKPQSIVESPRVCFSLKYSALSPPIDANNNQAFFCIVTQSREEFIYQTRKVALAVDSLQQVQGFLIALLSGVDPGSEDCYHLRSRTYLPPVELAVLSVPRHDFAKFKGRAWLHTSIEDWEEEINFMRFLNDDNWPDKETESTAPLNFMKPGRDANFRHFLSFFPTVVNSHRALYGSRPLLVYGWPDATEPGPQEFYLLTMLPRHVFLSLQRVLFRISGNIKGVEEGDGEKLWSQSYAPYHSDRQFRGSLYSVSSKR